MMPFTPIAGFLVLTHLIVNVVALCYRLLLSFIQKIKGERPNYVFMQWWFKKEYDTLFRRFVAYGLSTLTLGIVLGTSSLYLWFSTDLGKSLGGKGDTISNIIKTQDASAEIRVEPKPTITIDPFAFRSAMGMYPDSIVDILQATGVSDISVGYRADVAFKLGIVADPTEYRGTYDQNIELKERLRDELSSELLTKVQ